MKKVYSLLTMMIVTLGNLIAVTTNQAKHTPNKLLIIGVVFGSLIFIAVLVWFIYFCKPRK